MPSRSHPLVAFLFLLTGIASVEAQHCGGPCEVPRGADPVSANSTYTLSQGVETDNWRYLFNWFWTVNGEQKYRVEAALKSLPAGDFGFRRMFVSPSGNGFLVTGNSYAGKYLKGKEPPLFVFFDPEGKRISELSLFQALEANERKLGQCPGCDCADVLYVFAQDPMLSENGCFVELKPYEANSIAFFLPFGCPVRNRSEFEEALEAAEWSRLSGEQIERQKKEIDVFLRDLGSDELSVRTAAAEALVAKGFLARTSIIQAQYDSESGNLRARARAVEAKLRPLGGLAWEDMSIDLGLLASMLSYPEQEVAQAVRVQLERILPQSRGMPPEACVAWVKEHRQHLKWNAANGQYEE